MQKNKKMNSEMEINQLSRHVDDAIKWTIEDVENHIEVFEATRQKNNSVKNFFTSKDKKDNKKTMYKMDGKSRKLFSTQADKSYLITMKFLNGTQKTFGVKTNNYTFKLKDKLFYLYYEEAFYDLSMNQYHLTYIENCPVPINRETIYQGKEAFFALKPENLAELIKFNYIKILTNSFKLEGTLKTLLVLSFINLVINVISTLLQWAGNSGG